MLHRSSSYAPMSARDFLWLPRAPAHKMRASAIALLCEHEQQRDISRATGQFHTETDEYDRLSPISISYPCLGRCTSSIIIVMTGMVLEILKIVCRAAFA